MPTLASDSGISIELDDRFVRVPEHERDPVRLVVAIGPWGAADGFRPNITVTTESLAPDRATVEQLSMLTIAAEIALGRHVIGCESAAEPGQPATSQSARLIVSTYAAMDATIVAQQWVGICGGRAVTLTAQSQAIAAGAMQRALKDAVATLRWSHEEPPVMADPARMPRLDPAAGGEREDLGGVGAEQPRWAPGPRLSAEEVDSLRRGKLRRGVSGEGLQAAGLADADRRLTERGRIAHDILRARKPTVQVPAELRRDGGGTVQRLTVYAQPEAAVVVSGVGDGEAVDVVASGTLVDLLLRWIGVAPAWLPADRSSSFSVSHLDARVNDPRTPPPDGAQMALGDLWSRPWTSARFVTSQQGVHPLWLVVTAEAGTFVVLGSQSGAPDDISLGPGQPIVLIMLLSRLLGYQI